MMHSAGPVVRLLLLFSPILFAVAGYFLAKWKRRNPTLWAINCLLSSAIGVIVLICSPKLPPFDPDEPYVMRNSDKPVPPDVAHIMRDSLGVIYFVIALLFVIGVMVYNMVSA